MLGRFRVQQRGFQQNIVFVHFVQLHKLRRSRLRFLRFHVSTTSDAVVSTPSSRWLFANTISCAVSKVWNLVRRPFAPVTSHSSPESSNQSLKTKKKTVHRAEEEGIGLLRLEGVEIEQSFLDEHANQNPPPLFFAGFEQFAGSAGEFRAPFALQFELFLQRSDPFVQGRGGIAQQAAVVHHAAARQPQRSPEAKIRGEKHGMEEKEQRLRAGEQERVLHELVGLFAVDIQGMESVESDGGRIGGR